MPGPFAIAPIIPALPNLLLFTMMGLMWLLIGISAILRPSFWRFVIRFCLHQWRPLTVLMACGGVGWLGTILLTIGPDKGNGVTDPVHWPMARGTSQRLGVRLNSVGPNKLQTLWSFRAGRDAFYGSPVVTRNQVFAVGSRGNRARIYCLDRQTGNLLWDIAPGYYRTTFSSPVIVKGLLFCGEGVHMTQDARLICVDLQRREILWTLRTKSHVECTPVVVGPHVYVNAGDDGVYCVQVRPGSDGQANVVWHAPGSQFSDAETALLVHKGRVFVGLGVGGNALSVLDATSGKELKRIAFKYPLFAPPAIHGGKLYVGMGVGDMVTEIRLPAGEVCCIDLETLELQWRCKLPGSVLGAIVADRDGLMFGCWDGCAYKVSLLGVIEKQWSSGAPVVASLSVTKDRVYGINTEGLVFCLDRQSWALKTSIRLRSPGKCWSSPVVDSRQLFVGTELNGLMCLGQRQTDE